MEWVAKIRTSGPENLRTTCENYVLCGVDDTNRIDTQWIVIRDGENEIDVSVRLMAKLRKCVRKIGENLLRKHKNLSPDVLRGMVAVALDALWEEEDVSLEAWLKACVPFTAAEENRK